MTTNAEINGLNGWYRGGIAYGTGLCYFVNNKQIGHAYHLKNGTFEVCAYDSYDRNGNGLTSEKRICDNPVEAEKFIREIYSGFAFAGK